MPAAAFAPASSARSAGARARCRLALLLVVATAGGCAIERGIELPELGTWEQRRLRLTEMSDWGFAGRIGVSAGEEGFNGRLRWRQQGDAFAASVSGPFGAGAIAIDGDPSRVTVSERGGEPLVLRDPERDLRERYGWTIPMTSLRYWALGVPDPALPAQTEFGADGQLEALEQRNWLVTIPQYREDAGQLMPRRIVAVNGDAKIRLVIDDWTFY